MNIYYVYAYLRKNDLTPYYIGKGHDNRAWQDHKHIIVPTDKRRIVILETNLTELGALAIERRMIRWYGRKDNNTGILRNQTDGGEGVVNPSTSARLKMSNAKKGKPRSDETRSKISKTTTGRKLSAETIERMKLAANARKQSYLWWHNPLTQQSTRSNESPGEGWIRGRIKFLL